MKVVIWFCLCLLNLLIGQNTCLAQDLPECLSETAVIKTEFDTTLMNTSVIGTVETPTIEGGWLNIASNHSVQSKIPLVRATPTPSSDNKDVTTDSSTEKTLDDAWVGTDNLKPLLVEAAKDGKLATVLQKTARLKLPANLALIPMVESGYHTNAVSSKGAAGAWQLMPLMAKTYGLSNQDRFSFSLSTDAALQLLYDYYNRFHNWELVFAAYHAGSGRVVRALRCYPHAINLAGLHLPRETMQYVTRLRALNYALLRLAHSNHFSRVVHGY